ncbi:caspase Dronc-like [Neocloeon triangulifer]|uniref:caspase Dronc-like n=1 Tax=Neocloeon triangulifer TaxID=2078957 RepID=UPI00286F3FE0|nr:caspase Dronc-like [Neocloeon triangulifer]
MDQNNGMLEEDKEIINTNFDKLVASTSPVNLERIVDTLVQYGIFPEEAVKKYSTESQNLKTRKMEFYLDIQRQGPLAFEKLKHAMSACGYTELLNILQPCELHIHPSYAAYTGARPSHFPEYMKESIPHSLLDTIDQFQGASINLSTEAIEVSVRKAEQRHDLKISKSPRYRCGSSPKGLALIINIRDYEDKNHSRRRGAEHDDRNMEELFKQLGYDTEVHIDLEKKEFMDVIKTFVSNPKHFQVHTCMVSIMSHGRMLQPEAEDNVTSVFIASDGKTIPYTWVVDQFDAKNSPGLVNKPKVFFFQACRGETKSAIVKLASHRLVLNDTTEADGQGCLPPPVRRLSDILIAHATPRGFVALRDVNRGSWFIQKVVEVFMNKAHNTHVYSMLQEVDNALSRCITGDSLSQTMCIEQIGFNHKLFLSPGLFDKED